MPELVLGDWALTSPLIYSFRYLFAGEIGESTGCALRPAAEPLAPLGLMQGSTQSLASVKCALVW
eukprot:701444-Pleurochrysis_carterae.AAC.2